MSQERREDGESVGGDRRGRKRRRKESRGVSPCLADTRWPRLSCARLWPISLIAQTLATPVGLTRPTLEEEEEGVGRRRRTGRERIGKGRIWRQGREERVHEELRWREEERGEKRRRGTERMRVFATSFFLLVMESLRVPSEKGRRDKGREGREKDERKQRI